MLVGMGTGNNYVQLSCSMQRCLRDNKTHAIRPLIYPITALHTDVNNSTVCIFVLVANIDEDLNLCLVGMKT